MINLDTCKKASDAWEPCGDWVDTYAEALEAFNQRRYTPNVYILEKGIHFGKWHYRYSVRK